VGTGKIVYIWSVFTFNLIVVLLVQVKRVLFSKYMRVQGTKMCILCTTAHLLRTEKELPTQFQEHVTLDMVLIDICFFT